MVSAQAMTGNRKTAVKIIVRRIVYCLSIMKPENRFGSTIY